jgi:hypothetical protein
MREYVDYNHVPEHHAEIHQRLEQWARWVKPGQQAWKMQPMWRFFQSGWRQWHRPEVRPPVNTLEAGETERAICQLPEKERAAVRWCYVFGGDPIKMARNLGVTPKGLADAVQRGRVMLLNMMKISRGQPD